MGASAGPSLQGIGRGGDSNLVLEMDAHDAKSYPGEPTTNTIINGYFPGTDTTTVPTGWANWGSTAIRTFRPAGEEFFYKGLGLTNPRVVQWKGGGWYSDASSGYIGVQMPNPTAGFARSTTTTISFWYRFTGENAAQLSNQYIWFDFDYGLPNLSSINYTVYNDTEWHLHSETVTSSASYDYYNLYIYARPYAQCPGGSYFEIGAIQIEQKGYPTPFVGDGQFARPATTNLMIHGNVGTGQNFSDSSPSKHTITANGDVTHSGGQSKFSGGSIYFDGNGDYLSIPDSADWSFGSDDFTVDAWIYVSSFGGYHVIMGQDDDSTQRGWHFRTQVTSGDLLFRYSTTGSNETDIASSSTGMVINTWYHVAFVRASDTYAFYVNGVQKGSGSLTATFHASSTTMMVGARAGADLWFEGYMDEARVTKGTALWGGAFTPPTRRNLSAPVVDRSGNDNGGNFATKETTDVTTYRVGEVIRPIDSAVWDFDGTDDAINIAASPSIQINTGSISFWVYFKAYDAGDLIQMAIGSGSYAQWYVRSNPLSWNYYFEGGYRVVKTLTSAEQSAFFPLDTWLNVCWVFDKKGGSNAESSVYINGVEAFSLTAGSSGSIPWGTAGMTVGGYTWDGFTETKIAQYAMYNKVLTPKQIKENFNQQSSRFNVPNWRNRDIVQNGLDLWLDAGESASYPGTGSTWYDLTTNNYDGTIFNALYSSLGDGCFDFQGTSVYNDKVDVGPISTSGEHSSCTISLWFKKYAQATTYGNLFDCNYGITAANKGPRMEVDSGGSIVRVYMATDGGSYTSVNFGSLSNDVWYNAVLTVAPNGTGQDLKSYTDGALVSSSTSTSSYVWDGDVGDLMLGLGFNSSRFFTGKIATFALYNRVLSASEIEQNFIVQRQRFGK